MIINPTHFLRGVYLKHKVVKLCIKINDAILSSVDTVQVINYTLHIDANINVREPE
jgi:hypothetical protein